MTNKSNNGFKKIPWRLVLPIAGIILVLLLSVILLWHGGKNSNQSVPLTSASVYFQGEYRIADGEWQEIKKGEHISSTKGDVTLRGNFHFSSPGGEYLGVFKGNTKIAFYLDHINLTFYEKGCEPYVIDHENPLFGENACGENWAMYGFTSGGEVIEILVRNPHAYGNENAIDEMLAKTEFWSDYVGVQFEKEVLDSGATQRNTGLFFVITSFIFLGTALFSSLIHVKNSNVIWLLGAVIVFAGLYFTYSSFGISFWSQLIIVNTAVKGIAMMLYMFFISALIVSQLSTTKKVGFITNIVLGAINAVLFILPLITKVFFFDVTPYWIIAQSVGNIILVVCLIKDLAKVKGKEKFALIGAFFPLACFSVDALATWLGFWQGGIASQLVFIILFVVAMIILLNIIPKSINALTKAKELETEKLLLNTQLAESRVSTMMSQIRPHFIYNTLGSIEQLCEIDPPKAGELVHNFAKYLRGNFGELDNPKPILMSQEMEHVHHYISIENVRFPDMTFSFEMNSNDFHIPALTIQPIVENAIKHGLMKLQKGGTIRVVSYETDTNYCVLVEDDGVGFDTSVLLDERKHVGIRNIRGRLKAMVNGSLEIESKIGVGTKVLITIPKEIE